MTLQQIMNHVENWMQTKASPGLPERINFEDLCFAFLPSDLKLPAPFEEAVAAAAPTEGQSVLYHRADGSTARASVKTDGFGSASVRDARRRARHDRILRRVSICDTAQAHGP